MSNTNIVPVVEPNRSWRMWYIDDIFTGSGEGRYVPNKDDLVFSYTEGMMRVTQVDYSTGLSVLQTVSLPGTSGVLEEHERLLGSGPGRISESFRIYLDTSVTPHTLAVDSRLRMYGTTVKSMKVFKGTQIENGRVVSRMYDQQGQLLGENIPLEAADLDLTFGGIEENVTVKTPTVGYCSEQLPDGEVVTAVFYDDVGAVVSTALLLVKNTLWVRRLNAATKYITSIELESPFLSDADSRVLECPINIPLQSITMRGIVHYSNGEKRILPIDGTKFRLYGLQRFVSTVLGQRQPISLVYYLSPDEVASGSVNGTTQHITEDYMATTVKVDGAYTVKLFSYPTWIDAVNGYRLEHYLYNLDRDAVYRVTEKVEIATNSPAFRPLDYGVAQDITFALDLGSVDPTFKNYRHVQTTRFTLLKPGYDSSTIWTVNFDRTKAPYGEDVKAQLELINSNLKHVRVDNGRGSEEDWLRHLYEPTLPLFDETAEVKAPTPNYFRIYIGSFTQECPISMWNHEFTISNTVNSGENVYIEFFRRTSTTDLELGVVAIPIKQIN